MDTGSFGNRHLYSFGNLHTGHVWGVRLTGAFDCGEVHGPFSSESEADLYADRCADPEYRWHKIEVVTINPVKLERSRSYEWQEDANHARTEREENGRKVILEGKWKLTI